MPARTQSALARVAAVPLALAVALAGSSRTAPAQAPRATVTTLPRAPITGVPLSVLAGGGALNAHGQVAAFAYNGTTNIGVITGPDGLGPLRQVPFPAGYNLVNMAAVSDNGRGAGYGNRTSDRVTQLLYYDGTTTRPVAELPDGTTYLMGGVNDAGRIALSVARAGSNPFDVRPYVSGPDGGPLTRLELAGRTTGRAVMLNNAGRVAGSVVDDMGSRAVYWDPGADGYGAPVLLDGLGTGGSGATAVSASGSMTGGVFVGGLQRALYWSGLVHQSPTVLDAFAPDGTFEFMFGRGVNSAGQVVGVFGQRVGATVPVRAFVWDAVSGTRALDDLVDGWRFENAHAINDRGQILAYGRRAGGTVNEFALVTLSAVPEPGCGELLAAGLGGVFVATRRRRTAA